MGLEDAREDNLDMASQEDAVAVVAPGEEEVKKMESRGGFLVNGARQSSFNSGFTTDVFAGDIDMAQSQVAIAGSVDSAAEAAVSAGAEPSADVDTGPASSSDVVDSTEKVESWDLSEAVEESAGNKEESKPNFAEDGTLEYIKTQASSDLIADAPTSAASVQDSAGGVDLSVTSVEVEEKAVDLSSEDAEVVSEEFPVEVAASEGVSPKFQDEGSAEKGGSETSETPLEEVYEATEARTSAEADNEGAGVEAVVSPTADVEEKSDDVEEKLVDVEDEPADVQDKSVDVVDRSVEMNSEDAGAVSEELPAEVAASEEVSPETPDEESAETGDGEAPEAPVGEVDEVAETATSAEPDEDVATLEVSPSPFVDVEEKPFELGSEVARALSVDASPNIEDEGSAAERDESEAPAPAEEVNEVAEPLIVAEPLEVAPSPFVDVEEESFELDPEVARGVSEDVSPETEDEESAETGDSEAPEASAEEVDEVAEAATSAEPLEASPSPFVDVEEKSFELGSDVARALSVDASPDTEAEGSAAENGESEASAPAEEVNEVAELLTVAEPLEAAPSPFVDVEEDLFELDPEVAGAVSEDVSPETAEEGMAETGGSEGAAAPADEVDEVAEAATSAEPDEDVATLEASPSPFVDVEVKPFELGSDVARALSVDASPGIEAEGSAAENGESEASAPAEEVNEVAELLTVAEPLEAAPSPFVDVEEESFELDPEVAGAVSEDVSPEIADEESAENGDIAVPDEEVHEVTEAPTNAEPDEDVATLEAAASPVADVGEESVELDSEDVLTADEDVSPELEDEGSADKGESEAPVVPEEEGIEVANAAAHVEPDETSDFVEQTVDVDDKSVDLGDKAVGVEDKSVEVSSGDVGAVSEELPAEVAGSEELSATIPDGESAETGGSEAAEAPADEVDEVAEAAASAEPDEDVATLEASPSPFVDVEEKPFELGSDVARALSVDASPNNEAEGSAAEGVESEASAPAEEVNEVAEPLAVEPLEAAPSLFADLQEKSFELDPEVAGAMSEDVSPETEEEGLAEIGDSEAREASALEVDEVAEAATSAEPDEDVASRKAAPSSSVDVGEESVGVELENPITSLEDHEASANFDSVPAPAADVEDDSVQEVDSNDASEACEVPPSKSVDEEDGSPEPFAEGAADVVGTETRYVPDEDVHEVVEATISAEPDEGPESALAPSNVSEEKSVDLSSEDTVGVTTASESVDEEDVSPEPSIEATTSAGADLSLEPGDVEGSGSLQSLVDEGSAILESMSSPATNVQDGPADGSAEKVESESLFTPVEEVHEVVESTITAESDDGSTILESEPAPNDDEEKPEEPSKETTAELPSENSHDLPIEEVPAPIEETEETTEAATDVEPAVLESVAPSSEDVQATSESVSRESNSDDLKEALPSSDETISGKVATAIGEEGSSVDAVASDTIPLETSTPPPAVENTKAKKSYNLHEVAVHLEDAAEKTLEDVKSSAVGDGKASYSETVAHIVLDESSKTDDSSELISGVIQHVAQLAQDDFQSDPNVLPDTVNQVFSREAAGSCANDPSQPKENTSLGTKFSLFVIWCISLCASHVSSKSMPAPALKLGAEEVAAVLHSNGQGLRHHRLLHQFDESLHALHCGEIFF